jgi:hypothetical protein
MNNDQSNGSGGGDGKDVDVALAPASILALAVASLADLLEAERDLLTRKLEERECWARV